MLRIQLKNIETDSEKILAFFRSSNRNACYQDGLVQIDPHFEANAEIYYTVSETELILTSKFEKTFAIDENELEDFVWKAYCDPGKTPFKNIYRLRPSFRYLISKKGIKSVQEPIISHQIQKNENCKPDEFFSELRESLAKRLSNKFVGIFFSGGVDSLSLALLCQELSLEFKLYIGEEFPKYRDNQADVKTAVSICEYMGWDYEVVEVDYEKVSPDILSDFASYAPGAPHLSAVFYSIAKKMKINGVEIAISGQNLDNLYNYGLTQKFDLSKAGIIAASRAFYLTDFYLDSLIRPSIYGFIVKCFAYLPLIGYQYLKKSRNYRLPKSVGEAVGSFSTSPEYVTFIDVTDSKQNTLIKIKSLYDAHEYLLRHKIDAYTLSGPAVAIHCACKIFGFSSFLPFSAKEMIPLYLRRRHTIREIFKGKSFLYDYVNENKPDLYKVAFETSHDSKCEEYQKWIESQFLKTKFGSVFCKLYYETKSNNVTPAINLSSTISRYWLDILYKK